MKAGIDRPSNDLNRISVGSASRAGSSSPSSEVVQRVSSFFFTSQVHTSPELVAVVSPSASCDPSGEKPMSVSTPRGNCGCGRSRSAMRSRMTTRE